MGISGTDRREETSWRLIWQPVVTMNIFTKAKPRFVPSISDGFLQNCVILPGADVTAIDLKLYR